MKKEYDFKIANIRALAIVIVVFGHSIILYDPNWGYYTPTYSAGLLASIKQFINIFQMPLFFSVSGYCFQFSREKISKTGYLSFVKAKMKRLLIPFVAFALLWMIPLRMVSRYPYWQEKTFLVILYEIVTGKDSGHLWYLISLFLIFLLSGAIEIASNKCGIKSEESIIATTIDFMILAVFSFLAPFVPNILYIQNVAKYLMWFYFGYFMFGCVRKGGVVTFK